MAQNIDFDLSFSKKYLGVVEDIDDPLKLGRARVRVHWLFGTPADIPTADLPWAYQKYPAMFGKAGLGASMSVPKLNSIVEVYFNDNNIYAPEYHLIQELADDVKEELMKEYEGTHIFCIDGDATLKMYYTKTKGLMFQMANSRINVAPSGDITLEHAESSSFIELAGPNISITSDSAVNVTSGTRIKDTSAEVWMDGQTTKVGHEPQYSAVLGERLFDLLWLMANTIDAKMQPTPGATTALVNKMKKLALSDTVRVSK